MQLLGSDEREYATAYGRDDMRERAVALLQGLAPERNSVTRIFTAAGIGV